MRAPVVRVHSWTDQLGLQSEQLGLVGLVGDLGGLVLLRHGLTVVQRRGKPADSTRKGVTGTLGSDVLRDREDPHDHRAPHPDRCPAAPDQIERAIAELRAELAGRVLIADDADWDLAGCRGRCRLLRPRWRWWRSPTPSSTPGLAWASRHGHQVTAQPVGHGATTAFAQSMSNVVLLRTRALNGITVDVETRTATIGAGVKAGELLAALDGTGLTYLGGSTPIPRWSGWPSRAG